MNVGWILACNIAADLDTWTRLLGLHDQEDLVHADPETLRYRLWHLPAKQSVLGIRLVVVRSTHAA